jgi:hypothetical protein
MIRRHAARPSRPRRGREEDTMSQATEELLEDIEALFV